MLFTTQEALTALNLKKTKAVERECTVHEQVTGSQTKLHR